MHKAGIAPAVCGGDLPKAISQSALAHSMAKAQLHYFSVCRRGAPSSDCGQLRGRGEVIRMVLEHTQTPYDEVPIDYACVKGCSGWCCLTLSRAMKADTEGFPFGQVWRGFDPSVSVAGASVCGCRWLQSCAVECDHPPPRAHSRWSAPAACVC